MTEGYGPRPTMLPSESSFYILISKIRKILKIRSGMLAWQVPPTQARIVTFNLGRNHHVVQMKDIRLVYWPIDPDNTRMWMHPLLPIIFARPKILHSTSYHRRTEQSHSDRHHDPPVGKVTHYVVLDDHVILTTHLHKIYVCSITNRAEEAPSETPYGGSGYQRRLVDLTPSLTSTTSQNRNPHNDERNLHS